MDQLDALMLDLQTTQEQLRNGSKATPPTSERQINLEYLIADIQPPRATRAELDSALPELHSLGKITQQYTTSTTTTTTQIQQPATGQTATTPLTPNTPIDSMIGTLETNMNKHGIQTVPKGDCTACAKPIVGQVVLALGKMWHPEHFMCGHCNEPLSRRLFFERSGRAYCERDYHTLFSPRCAYCNGAIKEKCITALDRTWHLEHFLCAQCNNGFGDEGFHEKEGQAFCRNCYFTNFAPRCHGCSQAIQQNYITALGAQWHSECFVCQDCRQPFNSGSFFDHDGMPFCEQHYHEKRGSLCVACNQPIQGRCVTAMGHKFHPACFVCSFCRRQLSKGTFKEHESKPFCHECFKKLLN